MGQCLSTPQQERRANGPETAAALVSAAWQPPATLPAAQTNGHNAPPPHKQQYGPATQQLWASMPAVASQEGSLPPLSAARLHELMSSSSGICLLRAKALDMRTAHGSSKSCSPLDTAQQANTMSQNVQDVLDAVMGVQGLHDMTINPTNILVTTTDGCLSSAVVHSINDTLSMLFRMLEAKDYVQFLQSLMDTDAGLQAVLQRAVRAALPQAMSTEAPTVMYAMDAALDPSNRSTRTYMYGVKGLGQFTLTLYITPILFKDPSHPRRPEPMLFVEHVMSGHEQVLQHRIMRDNMLLSRVEAILTVVDLTGRVLHQNAASMDYAGNHTCLKAAVPDLPHRNHLNHTERPTLTSSSSTDGRASASHALARLRGSTSGAEQGPAAFNMLKELLKLEPGLLEDVVEELSVGSGEWQGVVRVPQSLKPALAAIGSKHGKGTPDTSMPKPHELTPSEVDKPRPPAAVRHARVQQVSTAFDQLVAASASERGSRLGPMRAKSSPNPDGLGYQRRPSTISGQYGENPLSTVMQRRASTTMGIMAPRVSTCRRNSVDTPYGAWHSPLGMLGFARVVNRPGEPSAGLYRQGTNGSEASHGSATGQLLRPRSQSAVGSTKPQPAALSAMHNSSTAGEEDLVQRSPSAAQIMLARRSGCWVPPVDVLMRSGEQQGHANAGTSGDHSQNGSCGSRRESWSSSISHLQVQPPSQSTSANSQRSRGAANNKVVTKVMQEREAQQLAVTPELPSVWLGQEGVQTNLQKLGPLPTAADMARSGASGSSNPSWPTPPSQEGVGGEVPQFSRGANAPGADARSRRAVGRQQSRLQALLGNANSTRATAARVASQETLRVNSMTSARRSSQFNLPSADTLPGLPPPLISPGAFARLSMEVPPALQPASEPVSDASSVNRTTLGNASSAAEHFALQGSNHGVRSSSHQVGLQHLLLGQQVSRSSLSQAQQQQQKQPTHASDQVLEPEVPTRWHQISATTERDPVTGQRVIILVQTDVSERIEAEERVVQVSEASLALLELIFPRHVIEFMALGRADAPVPPGPSALPGLGGKNYNELATKHESVTILFCDIVGFTEMSRQVEAVDVMSFLNNLYTRYDELLDVFNVYKVETVGDCYVVAGGLIATDEEGFAVVTKNGANSATHARDTFQYAQAMLEEAAHVVMPHNGEAVKVRIGIHTGPITSGVVGYRMPKFCLFGDTMNTASRMESTCPAGCIHMSAATQQLLEGTEHVARLQYTGGVQVKGKGRMETYLYDPVKYEARLAANGNALAAGLAALSSTNRVLENVSLDSSPGVSTLVGTAVAPACAVNAAHVRRAEARLEIASLDDANTTPSTHIPTAAAVEATTAEYLRNSSARPQPQTQPRQRYLQQQEALPGASRRRSVERTSAVPLVRRSIELAGQLVQDAEVHMEYETRWSMARTLARAEAAASVLATQGYQQDGMGMPVAARGKRRSSLVSLGHIFDAFNQATPGGVQATLNGELMPSLQQAPGLGAVASGRARRQSMVLSYQAAPMPQPNGSMRMDAAPAAATLVDPLGSMRRVATPGMSEQPAMGSPQRQAIRSIMEPLSLQHQMGAAAARMNSASSQDPAALPTSPTAHGGAEGASRISHGRAAEQVPAGMPSAAGPSLPADNHALQQPASESALGSGDVARKASGQQLKVQFPEAVRTGSNDSYPKSSPSTASQWTSSLVTLHHTSRSQLPMPSSTSSVGVAGRVSDGQHVKLSEARVDALAQLFAGALPVDRLRHNRPRTQGEGAGPHGPTTPPGSAGQHGAQQGEAGTSSSMARDAHSSTAAGATSTVLGGSWAARTPGAVLRPPPAGLERARSGAMASWGVGEGEAGAHGSRTAKPVQDALSTAIRAAYTTRDGSPTSVDGSKWRDATARARAGAGTSSTRMATASPRAVSSGQIPWSKHSLAGDHSSTPGSGGADA